MSRVIYLCGPINGRTTEDATNWRELVKERWMSGGGRCLDPMARDYRGRELEPGIAAEIVAGDIEDIQNSDAILVFFDKPSVGTAMEVFYAKHVLNKPVVVIDASDKPLSPWLQHHSDHQCKHVGTALAAVNMLLNARDSAV
jgi:nucleoside 2-deoxyribosyltransferase